MYFFNSPEAKLLLLDLHCTLTLKYHEQWSWMNCPGQALWGIWVFGTSIKSTMAVLWKPFLLPTCFQIFRPQADNLLPPACSPTDLPLTKFEIFVGYFLKYLQVPHYYFNLKLTHSLVEKCMHGVLKNAFSFVQNPMILCSFLFSLLSHTCCNFKKSPNPLMRKSCFCFTFAKCAFFWNAWKRFTNSHVSFRRAFYTQFQFAQFQGWRKHTYGGTSSHCCAVLKVQCVINA